MNMNRILVRITAIFLLTLCLCGYTGPSCGYGEETVNDSEFDSSLVNPTFTTTPQDGEVIVSWNAVTGVSSYNIYIEKSSKDIGETIKKGSVQSPQKIDGLTNGQKYYIAVQSIGSDKRLGVIKDKTINFTPNPIFLQMANKDIDITDEQIKTLQALKVLVGKNSSIADKTDNEEAYKALNALKTIDLTAKSVIDIKALQSFKKATKLILDENKIVDLLPLIDLDTALVSLSISKTMVTDLSPILEIEKLEELIMIHNNGDGDTEAPDLSTFSSTKLQTEILKNFKKLTIQDCELDDLTGIGWLTLIENLNLSDNNISTLEPIQNFDKLKELKVSGNPDLSADDDAYSNLRTAILSNNGTVEGPGVD